MVVRRVAIAGVDPVELARQVNIASPMATGVELLAGVWPGRARARRIASVGIAGVELLTELGSGRGRSPASTRLACGAVRASTRSSSHAALALAAKARAGDTSSPPRPSSRRTASSACSKGSRWRQRARRRDRAAGRELAAGRASLASARPCSAGDRAGGLRSAASSTTASAPAARRARAPAASAPAARRARAPAASSTRTARPAARRARARRRARPGPRRSRRRRRRSHRAAKRARARRRARPGRREPERNGRGGSASSSPARRRLALARIVELERVVHGSTADLIDLLLAGARKLAPGRGLDGCPSGHHLAEIGGQALVRGEVRIRHRASR